MRIVCPHCGVRDVREFAYLGDATVTRPDPGAPDALARFIDYVYLRDNPAGAHHELWYHAAGCQAWLKVARDTRTHDIAGVESLRDGSLGGPQDGTP
jgi:methylglutamate dehydrogenase subunit B